MNVRTLARRGLLFDRFRACALRRPDRVAVESRGRDTTYGELLAGANAWCLRLRVRGVNPGQRLAAIGDDSVELIALYLAASSLGLTLTFLHDISDGRVSEWVQLLEDAKPSWLVIVPGASLPISEIASVGLETIAWNETTLGCSSDSMCSTLHAGTVPIVLMYTSGTTGKPKGVAMSERALTASAENVATAMQIDWNSRVLLTGMMINTTGSTVALGTLLQGGAICLLRHRSHGAVLSQIEADRITHTMLKPIVIAEAVANGELERRDLSSLECIAYGTAQIAPNIIQKARSIVPCEWIQGYGLTETCGPIVWLSEEDHVEGRLSCCGRAAGGIELCILGDTNERLDRGSVGEVAVRGSTLMDGYWDIVRQEAAPVGADECGWFRTGDLGRIGSDGYLHLLGRAKDVVITGNGFTISCVEVENVLTTAPGVVESAVVSWKSSSTALEVPVAVLRVSDGWSEWPALKHLIEQSLSSPKRPARFLITSSPITRNANGKLDKSKITKQVHDCLNNSGAPPDKLVTLVVPNGNR